MTISPEKDHGVAGQALGDESDRHRSGRCVSLHGFSDSGANGKFKSVDVTPSL